MINKRTKKIIFSAIIGGVCILFFVDRCTTINLTTSNIFRNKYYDNFKELSNNPQCKSYEIIPARGTFPILYDSIKNEFYLKNSQGLTKYDAFGNVLISNDLEKEKYTSAFDFANFIPYIFAENGVYDFSGKELVYSAFSKVFNSKNEIGNEDFKSIFEKYYDDAELVVYDTDRNIESDRECYPMYFKIKDQWILLFSQKGDDRFTHLNNGIMESDTIGQIDFKNNPAKFSNKRLIFLKDYKNKTYSSEKTREDINDQYLDTYFGQILKERKLDYKTNDLIKMLSYKKESYYSGGNFFNLPSWITPSFINKAYFKLSYHNENLFFRAKAIKYFNDSKFQNNLFLYELPQNLRKKTDVAFLDYNFNLDEYVNGHISSVDPKIINTGLYLIRKK